MEHQSYAIEAIIAVVTFIISVGTSMFIAGMRWQEVHGDLRQMADRLAKIEGMFTLKLRDHDNEH